MAPRHTQGCEEAAYLATAHLTCPTNQELVCWFILPTPCLSRRPPIFIPFRVSSCRLNSHFSFFSGIQQAERHRRGLGASGFCHQGSGLSGLFGREPTPFWPWFFLFLSGSFGGLCAASQAFGLGGFEVLGAS